MEKHSESLGGFRNNALLGRLPVFKSHYFGPNAFLWALIALPLFLYVSILTIPHNGWLVIPAALACLCCIIVFQPSFEIYLVSIFILVCWFPEFSQSDFEIYSSDEFASLYNYRPIPGITASVFDYLFAAIVVVWLMHYVFPNPGNILKIPLARPVLFFLAVWTFNLIHGLAVRNETYYALREFRVGAYFALAYLMVATICSNPRRMRNFVQVILLMAAIVGVYGICRYALGLGQELEGVHIVYYDLADSMVMYFALLFMTSFTIGGVPIGSNFAVTALLAMPMIFSFLFSYRRGSWLAFIAGVLFLLWSYPGRARIRRAMVRGLFIPAVVVVSVILAVPAVRSDGLIFVATRFTSIFDVTGNASNIFRILDALNALSSFVKHPIFGVGAGGRYDLQYISQSPDMMAFMDHVSNASHNGFLFVLFKSGILGFCSYLAIFVQFLRLWVKARTAIWNPRDRAVLMALGSVVIAVLLNNMFDPLSDTLRPSILVAFVMGWGTACITRGPGPSSIASVAPAVD